MWEHESGSEIRLHATLLFDFFAVALFAFGLPIQIPYYVAKIVF